MQFKQINIEEHDSLSNHTTGPGHQAPPRRKSRTEGEPLDPQALAAKRAKAEKIGRTAAVFIMPLLIVGMMIWGYLGAMHHQEARDMPVAIAATSTAQAEDFAAALEQANAEAVEISIVDSQREARDEVYDRDASAAVFLDGKNATFYTAGGAGVSAASSIQAVITPVMLEQDLKISAEDVAPLPANDPSGMGAMFLATAMVTAGYMPWSMAFSNSPELLRRRRALPLLAGWSLLMSALGALIAGPILGVLDGAQSVQVMGVLALGVFAVGAGQLLLTRLFGAMAVIPGMFLFMVLGQPASNLGMSIHVLPEFYTFLHQFLPMPALGEALRSVMYFNGDGAAIHLLILTIGAVAALLLTQVIDNARTAKGKSTIPTEINVAGLHGGPRPKSNAWRYITLGAIPLGMVGVMLTFMLGAMQSPTVRDMPVAVVGSTIEQAEQTAAGLEGDMEGMFDFTVLDDPEEAKSLISQQDLAGVFVLPTAENPQAVLYTAQASGNSNVQVLSTVFGQVAGAQQLPLDHQELAPLPEGDNVGMTAMYLGMGWIMAGFMVIIVGDTAAPHARRLKNLLPLLAGYSVFMSAVLYLIAGPFTGAVHGHFWALLGTGALAIFSVALFSTIFSRLMGMLAMLPILAVVMFLGVPASNASLSIYMVPQAFGWLHDILPMPAATESIRSILYFDSVGVGSHLITLALWGLISLAVVMVLDQIKPVRGHMHPVPEEVLAELRGQTPADKAALAAESANEIDDEASHLADDELEKDALGV
ncbi:hypothetical protein AA310_17075 [Arthrobacter sp. YC-RL1]|uniref:ABC transporter permease n=1 Tax=Arthrobacter sp. YC-RL1 TaxID=1652545 RepID=UPI00063D97F4|nr:ABC transporter permease [Arthrobacter sp. YC-RL1]ALQ29252.1 hypothetical protein ATC04_00980 [Arthrobacter sp. YC-RL1]KLI89351.1 hypothetical protein AA310_17075 [Arthrobacter sp. YC-RL1]